MAPAKKAPGVDAVSSTQPTVTSTFRIPCFAHQALDPARFPKDHGRAMAVPEIWATANPQHERVEVASEDSGENEGESEDEEASGIEAVREKVTKKRPMMKRKRENKPKHVPDQSYKRIKVSGGRPATVKKVTANLDSDDELIIRMKNAKYLEKDIAQHLVNEGRIAYNPKTIGTRYARIMKAVRKANDKLLDEDLTDWHEGDDDALEQAIAKAERDVQRQKAKVDEQKWRIVADELKKIKPVLDFSQHACRKRYEALMEGTAKPTPESIANPDEKTMERIKSRREKLKRIQEDTQKKQQRNANVEGNAWTSRAVRYF